MKTNYIKSIRLLYGLYAGILLVCLGLFICNVIAAAERPQMASISTPNNLTFTITDLHAADSLYNRQQPLTGTPDGVNVHAHINRYDIDVTSEAATLSGHRTLCWVLVLQVFEMVAMAAILFLVIVTLASFYRSAKRGQIFPAKNVSALLVIGVLLVLVSLCMDTSTYLERTIAFDLLKDTQWVPAKYFSIHFTRIFFGLTLIFLSQIFKIGRDLQDEQELTI